MAIKTPTLNLPLAAIGRLSVRDALNRGFELLDTAHAAGGGATAATVKLTANIAGGSPVNTTVQATLAALTARVTALEAG